MKKKVIVSTPYMPALGLYVHHEVEVDMRDTELLKKYQAEIMKDGLVEFFSTHIDLHRGLTRGFVYGGQHLAGALMALRLVPYHPMTWDLKDIDNVIDYVIKESGRPWKD